MPWRTGLAAPPQPFGVLLELKRKHFPSLTEVWIHSMWMYMSLCKSGGEEKISSKCVCTHPSSLLTFLVWELIGTCLWGEHAFHICWHFRRDFRDQSRQQKWTFRQRSALHEVRIPLFSCTQRPTLGIFQPIPEACVIAPTLPFCVPATGAPDSFVCERPSTS